MSQEKRFGRRIAEPSSVQIMHELKLMALRQSLDAATAREGATASGVERDLRVDVATLPSSSDLV